MIVIIIVISLTEYQFNFILQNKTETNYYYYIKRCNILFISDINQSQTTIINKNNAILQIGKGHHIVTILARLLLAQERQKAPIKC